MATAFVGNAASDSQPAVTTHNAGELTVNHGSYTISAALVINDTIALCKLPANHIVVDAILDVDDLDTDGTPAIVLDVGIVGGDVDSLMEDITTAQAGGLARMTSTAARRDAAVSTDTVHGVKVVTAPATGATTGTIALTLLSRVKGRND